MLTSREQPAAPCPESDTSSWRKPARDTGVCQVMCTSPDMYIHKGSTGYCYCRLMVSYYCKLLTVLYFPTNFFRRELLGESHILLSQLLHPPLQLSHHCRLAREEHKSHIAPCSLCPPLPPFLTLVEICVAQFLSIWSIRLLQSATTCWTCFECLCSMSSFCCSKSVIVLCS